MSKKKTGSHASQGGFAELKKRLLFLLIGILVYRFGAYIPLPGLDPDKLSALFNQHSSGLLGMFNVFSGGALSRMTLFAMGIMPYISASIIIQLYSQVSPKLQQIKKEGQAGRTKINQYTRYGTVLLSFFQSLFMTKWLVSKGVVLNPNFVFFFVAVTTLVTGTILLVWIGEQITERGIGNGISLIIFAGIASRFPSAVGAVFTQVHEGQLKPITLIMLFLIIAAVTLTVVFIERAQRRIAINYAMRSQGRKMVGGQSSHLPLKINMAGVIPVIFAQSMILFPGTIATFIGKTKGFGWMNQVALALQFGQPLYLILFAFAIIFFCFFYTAMVFNPKETADNLKKSGAFIPGIRPGEQTANYVDKVLTRLTLVGAFYLTLVALFPQFLILTWNVPFYFGGTSLLIVVVVIMDLMAQIQSYMLNMQMLNKNKNPLTSSINRSLL